MILYLAHEGLLSTQRSRRAAALTGANGRQTFLRVVFTALKPVNVIILVIKVWVLRSLRRRHGLGGGGGSAASGHGALSLYHGQSSAESSHIGATGRPRGRICSWSPLPPSGPSSSRTWKEDQ